MPTQPAVARTRSATAKAYAALGVVREVVSVELTEGDGHVPDHPCPSRAA